jgi:glycosyl transferase family 87
MTSIARSPRFYLIAGLLIRESVSFWTGHPFDLEIWIRNAYYVAMGDSPYGIFPPIQGLSFAYLNEPITSVGYLPLWSLMLAALFKVYALLAVTNRFILIFFIKQPEILGDVVLGYALFKIVGRFGGTKDAANRVLSFWMLCPYPIIISAIWGQFDGLVAFLWVSFLFVQFPIRRSILLGLGVLLKFFPAIALVYYLFIGRLASWRITALAALIPTSFSVLAFAFSGWSYQPILQTLKADTHGVPAGMTYARLLAEPFILPTVNQINGFFLVAGLIWIPALILASILALKFFPKPTPENSVQAVLLITLFFLLTRWSVYEQYMIYLIAFLLIDVTLWHPQRRQLFHVTWILSMIFLVINNLLFIRFLGPAIPSMVDYANFLDNASAITGIRYALLDVLGVIFSIHLIQLTLVIAHPKKDPASCLIRAIKWTIDTISGKSRKVIEAPLEIQL